MSDKMNVKKATDADSATKEFNEHHIELVQDGDVERIDESLPKSAYEKKTKRWFLERNQRL